MSRDDKFPVEPLSDASWSRIERSVLERAQQPLAPEPRSAGWGRVSPRFAALLAAATVVQAAVILLMFATRTPEPVPLARTRIVADRAFTETMLDDIAIRLEPASALTVLENRADSSRVLLERGVASFSVPARGQRPAFAVQAGAVLVQVVGTRFRVTHVDHTTRVDVEEGKVRVSVRGEDRLLHAGESFRDRQVEARGSAREQSQEASTSQPVRAKSAAAPTSAARPEPARTHAVALEAPSPARRPALEARASARDQDDTDTSRAPAETAQQRFDRAALLEASDPGEALRIYASLAAQGGRWGETALYAMGRLELERGHRAAASRVLRSYLREYPAGANAADVAALVQRLGGGVEAAGP